jgi:hypothetical protein
MLDAIGLAAWLGMPSTAGLWHEENHLVHFTSAVRYPLFVDGENWSGQPDILRCDLIRGWVERFTAVELANLGAAALVPLGPAVTRALQHLATVGFLDEARLLTGLPHPSGANAERVACFLGVKPPHLASAKTDARALVAARDRLQRQVASLPRPVP